MKLKPMYRALGADDVVVDKENRTVEFSFSSEYPVDRWFGKEVLSHAKGAADLTRLNSGANLLWNHNMDEVRGVIESAEIRTEKKKGFVKARFSKSAPAEQLMSDVEDRVIKNVSFGYRVLEMERTSSSVDQGDEYVVTRWEPYEVSFVSIPADPTVGIGRSDSDEEREVKIVGEAVEAKRVLDSTNDVEPLRGKRNMEDKELAVKAEADKKAAVELAIESERVRTKSIAQLGEKFKKQDLARQLIEGGKSVEEARGAFLDAMGAHQKPVSETETEIGLNDKEKREFSWMRALRALANPTDRQAQKEAAFEFEVSRAAIEKSGRPLNGNGIRIPLDVLKGDARRDLNIGTSTQGGHLVSTDLMSGSFIEMLRNRLVLPSLGATIMNGLQGNVAIPRQTGGGTAYYVAEGSNLTESTQAVDQVTMSPHTVGAYSDYSRKMLLQSSIDPENLIKSDLAKVLALEIDRASFYGAGSSNEPLGVKNVSGIKTVDFSANAPTYAELLNMESSIAAANADEASMAFVANALGRGVLKGVYTNATYGEIPVWAQSAQGGQAYVMGYRAFVSNQISRVSTGKEHYWLGNFADLVLGFWSGLDVLVDPYAGALAGNVRIICMQDFDVAVRHAESFCLGSNLT